MATIRDRIKEILEGIEGAHTRTFQNKDGSIDGEITLPVERGEAPEAKLAQIEDAIRDERFPRDAFIATGFRLPSGSDGICPTSESPRGVNQVYSVFYTRKDLPKAFAASMSIIDSVRRKGVRKPSQVIVRIHWNRWGKKPKRRK